MEKLKKIVLLEFVDEAEAFLKYCKNNNTPVQGYLILALQPEVQVYLKRNNIAYHNSFDYFSNENHERALLKSEEWCQYLRQRVNITDGTEIKETYNNLFLFSIRFYIHYFLYYVEIISTVCEKHEVETFYACLLEKIPRGSGQNNPIFLIEDEQRFLGLIAKLFADYHGIKFYEIPLRLPAENTGHKKQLTVFRRIISGLYKSLLFKYLKNKRIIILPTLGYNLANLIEKLRGDLPDIQWLIIGNDTRQITVILLSLINKLLFKKNTYLLNVPFEAFSCVDFNRSSRTDSLRNSISAIIKKMESSWHDYFNYKNVNFTRLFLDKIRFDLGEYLVDLSHKSAIIAVIMKDLNVKMIISPFARMESLLLGEWGYLNSIPAMMVSHGTLTMPKNNLEYISNFYLGESLILSKFFDYVALQTPNEERVLNYYGPKKNTIKTGALVFSKSILPRKKEFLKKYLPQVQKGVKVLLYPENVRERFSMRFHVFETFDEFLSDCMDLIASAEKIDGIHLVIRLHPGRTISPEEFKLLLPRSDKFTVISYEGPFYELLTITDLLINFSSTAIEDALQNHLPVLLYDKRKRYKHCNAAELSRNNGKLIAGVYYINDASFLSEGIQWIISNHLNREIPGEVFNDYIYHEDYSGNLKEFIQSKVG